MADIVVAGKHFTTNVSQAVANSANKLLATLAYNASQVATPSPNGSQPITLDAKHPVVILPDVNDTLIGGAGLESAAVIIGATTSNINLTLSDSSKAYLVGFGVNNIVRLGENDTFIGGSGGGTLSGGSGDQVTVGNGNYTGLWGGSDTVNMGAGASSISVMGDGDYFSFGAGDSTVNVSSGASNLAVTTKGNLTVQGATTTSGGDSANRMATFKAAGNLSVDLRSDTGNDVITASGVAINITTGTGQDTVNLTAGSNTVDDCSAYLTVKSKGNVTIDGDTLVGGGQSRLAVVGTGNVNVDFSNHTGDDSITASGFSVNIMTGTGHDTLSLGAGSSTVISGWGDNLSIKSKGDVTLNDTFVGGTGLDTLGGITTVTAVGNVNVDFSSHTGDDVITASGLAVSITTGTGSDTINLAAGPATIDDCSAYLMVNSKGSLTLGDTLLGGGMSSVTAAGNVNVNFSSHLGGDTLIGGSGDITLGGGHNLVKLRGSTSAGSPGSPGGLGNMIMASGNDTFSVGRDNITIQEMGVANVTGGSTAIGGSGKEYLAVLGLGGAHPNLGGFMTAQQTAGGELLTGGGNYVKFTDKVGGLMMADGSAKTAMLYGAGHNVFTGGSGMTNVVASAGHNDYVVNASSFHGGTMVVHNFVEGEDTISLVGYDTSMALANVTHTNHGAYTVLSLSDGTKIELVGNFTLHASDFG